MWGGKEDAVDGGVGFERVLESRGIVPVEGYSLVVLRSTRWVAGADYEGNTALVKDLCEIRAYVSCGTADDEGRHCYVWG